MAFKMKGPTFFKNTPLKQTETAYAGESKKETLNVKKGSAADKKSKKTKSIADYLDEGFSQVEAEQMYLRGATTGRTASTQAPNINLMAKTKR